MKKARQFYYVQRCIFAKINLHQRLNESHWAECAACGRAIKKGEWIFSISSSVAAPSNIHMDCIDLLHKILSKARRQFKNNKDVTFKQLPRLGVKKK
jgi:hypothetical protein